jgi:Clostripain family
MKRIVSDVTIWILFFVVVIIVAWAGPAQSAEREWLILVYVSGVNDRGMSGSADDLINQLEKVGSTDRVTVVVKYNILGKGKDGGLKFQREVRTLLIKADNGNPKITSPVIDDSPQTDMASALNLFLFARKNMVKYPSRKVMLVLWGKGEGFKGVAQDDLSRKKMGVEDVAKALSRLRKERGKKIDIFVTDADLMQMVEVVYELKDEADIVIGSEESVSGPGYCYDLTLQEVVDDPTINPRKLASAMVYYGESTLSSAVRTNKVDELSELLDQWVTAMMSDRVALRAAAATMDGTFSFGMKDSKDLCDYIDRVVGSLPPDAPTVKAGNDLENYIRKEVVLATHTTTSDPRTGRTVNRPYERAHGLAIYLPDITYDSNAYEPLAFAVHCRWRDFLMAVLGEKLKK